MNETGHQINNRIEYEDDDLCIVYKSAGVLMHSNHYERTKDNLLNQISGRAGQKLFPINRLDKATQGLVIFAKNEIAVQAMNRIMSQKEIIKRYRAILVGPIPKDPLLDYKLKNHGRGAKVPSRTRIITSQKIGSFSPHEYQGWEELALVHLGLETGRRHQIRQHASLAGCPVLGDNQYGKRGFNREWERSVGYKELYLQSYYLSFPHPSKADPVVLEIPIPNSWIKIINQQ